LRIKQWRKVQAHHQTYKRIKQWWKVQAYYAMTEAYQVTTETIIKLHDEQNEGQSSITHQ
jgi:hypothetical protein